MERRTLTDHKWDQLEPLQRIVAKAARHRSMTVLRRHIRDCDLFARHLDAEVRL